MEYTWNIHTLSSEDCALVNQLATELNISPVAARMLVVRGIRTAESARSYIRPSLDQLHDPFLMRDMDRAVERLHRALRDGERIMVYGDYDVDGTTAVALFYSYLRRIVLNPFCSIDRQPVISYYIPDRYTEGYGISYQGIDTAQADGVTLIVALDCGIKATDKVAYATERGIDFIICDHHTPGDTIPDAVAVLDAERADNTYPYDKLSGCGVGFKLAQAHLYHILDAAGAGPEQRKLAFDTILVPLLPLLAMSIASDIVPVTDENRILAFFGLKQLNSAPPVGVRAIMDIAGIKEGATMTDLVFKIGPRINACGRLYSGSEAVRLLITEDPTFAQEQAQAIDAYNRERRDYDSTTTEQAIEQLRQDPLCDTLHTNVVFNPTWHKGVVGIAASRITETYYRPTIVLTASDDDNANGERIISGSARSVSDFNIYDAIDSCRDLLTNFGGHAFAAGLSMHEKDLPEFKRRFEEYVAAHITPDQLQPSIAVEDTIAFSDITPLMFRVIQCLEPFGPENPRPVFVTRHVTNARYTKRCGEQGKHLKLDVTDGTACFGGIAFSLGEWALTLQQNRYVDLVYSLETNTFNGRTAIELQVQDIKNETRF